MIYNDTTVVIGGLIHIPIVIGLLRLVEGRFKTNKTQYQNN